jgi:hypothetical protein
MIYELSQLIFNNGPQWPKVRPTPRNVCVPDATPEGRIRHFAVVSVLVQNAGGSWTRTVVWDEREMA